MAKFNVISWSPNEPVTDYKLDAMVENDNWLRDNMVIGQLRNSGPDKNSGIKIAAGLVAITANKTRQQTKAVRFNNFFTSGCKPNVTTGVYSAANGHKMVWVTIDGEGAGVVPTNIGFNITAYIETLTKTKKITKNFYVSWQAVGY